MQTNASAASAAKQYNITVDYRFVKKAALKNIIPFIPNVISSAYRNYGFECSAYLTPSDVGIVISAIIPYFSDDYASIEVYGGTVGSITETAP